MTFEQGDLYRRKVDDAGKPRLIVIVSREEMNRGDCVVAIPFYSRNLAKRRTQPSCAFFAAGEGGLLADCVAKTDEITYIDKLELDLVDGPVGCFNEIQMQRLLHALRWTLSIP